MSASARRSSARGPGPARTTRADDQPGLIVDRVDAEPGARPADGEQVQEVDTAKHDEALRRSVARQRAKLENSAAHPRELRAGGLHQPARASVKQNTKGK